MAGIALFSADCNYHLYICQEKEDYWYNHDYPHDFWGSCIRISNVNIPDVTGYSLAN